MAHILIFTHTLHFQTPCFPFATSGEHPQRHISHTPQFTGDADHQITQITYFLLSKYIFSLVLQLVLQLNVWKVTVLSLEYHILSLFTPLLLSHLLNE